MRGVNWRRVILGSVLAGTIINVCEFFLNGVVLVKDWEAAILSLGKPPIAGSRVAVFLTWGFLLWGLIVASSAMWLYAVIRPRYGGGPKLALGVGSFIWSLSYLFPSVTPFLLNLFPRRIFFIGLTVGLVEVLFATLVGAWVYREPDALEHSANQVALAE